MKNNLFLISVAVTLTLLNPLINNAQTVITDTVCLKKMDGYILKIYQKEGGQYVSTSSDYFFFKEKPDIKSINTPNDLLNLGGIIINRGYMLFADLKKSQESNIYKGFYEYEPILKENKKDFIIEYHRVSIIYFSVNEKLSKYIQSSEWSNTHSYFMYFDKESKEKIYNIIYPEMIIPW